MTPEEAVAIVAERAIWAATREIEWSDYGDIGEQDWQRVVDEIDQRVNPAALDLYRSAYDVLAARATTEG